MTTRDEPWKTGTPCWVDLIVPDVEKAVAFYSELFGWDCEEGAYRKGGQRRGAEGRIWNFHLDLLFGRSRLVDYGFDTDRFEPGFCKAWRR